MMGDAAGPSQPRDGLDVFAFNRLPAWVTPVLGNSTLRPLFGLSVRFSSAHEAKLTWHTRVLSIFRCG